ncbi:MAG: transcriptional repressor, partial [Elusimicrobia bacterium]|nr:transcriptional repressor [Elusimicrobiota bacterium]
MPHRRGFGPPPWRGWFRGCGYRITVPREAIMEVLKKEKKHLSAEDIYMAVHRDHPHIGLTTVY